MKTVFEIDWSSGEPLLDNAGLCVLQSSIRGSFRTQASTPQSQFAALFAASNSWTYGSQPCQARLPSRGFSIDQISRETLKLDHPNDTLYSFTPSARDGVVNFNCISQLDLTIARLGDGVVHAPTSDVTGVVSSFLATPKTLPCDLVSTVCTSCMALNFEEIIDTVTAIYLVTNFDKRPRNVEFRDSVFGNTYVFNRLGRH